jgi:hypothetical protein
MMSSSYALWSIWRELPILLKVFFLILSLVSVCTLFSAFAAVVRLRSLTNRRKAVDTCSLQHSVAALRIRAENMRQLVGATFYLSSWLHLLSDTALGHCHSR